MFYTKGVLKIFSKFTGKQLSWSLNLQVCNFIKKEIPIQVFTSKFCEIFKIPFVKNTSGDCFWNILFIGPNYEAQNKVYSFSFQKVKLRKPQITTKCAKCVAFLVLNSNYQNGELSNFILKLRWVTIFANVLCRFIFANRRLR